MIPLTVFFSGKIANGGQASSHTRQAEQKSSTPCDFGFERGSGASVRIADNLNDYQNSGFMMEPCFPNSPKPAAIAAGIIVSVLAIGPVRGLASQPS